MTPSARPRAIRRVVVARHGDTFLPHEPPRRIGARSDPPLTPRGEAQARALGDHLRAHGFRFGTILSGPLARTRRTATAAGYDPQVAHWLTEIDHGPDEDRPEPAVLARLGADALAAWDRDAVPPLGWTVDAPARLACWRGLLLAPDPGDVLVVTSAGAARFAPLSLGHRPPGGPKLRTGAYGVFEDDSLTCWNITIPA